MGEPSSYSSSERTPWGLVLHLVGAGVVGAFQVGKAPPMLFSIRSELGMSLFLAGWILSIFNVTGFLLGSMAGAMADSFGHRHGSWEDRLPSESPFLWGWPRWRRAGHTATEIDPANHETDSYRSAA